MKYVLVNKDIEKKSVEILKNYGKVVKTIENKNLLCGLKAHPDILVHVLPNGDVICDRENYDYYKNIFSDRNVIPSERFLDKDYPGDIPLNCFSFKNYFIHNTKYTDKKILDFYKRKGYNIINVKQGYSKCSTLVTRDFLITEDAGIYKSLKDTLPIYKIDSGQIKLRNFNYGFIGGSSGSIEKELFLTGDYKKHSSSNIIDDVVKKYKYKLTILSDKEIEDYGSILFV